MKRALFFLLIVASHQAGAQADSVYNVACILPFRSGLAFQRMNEFFTAHDVTTANKIRLHDESILSLEFYRGVEMATRRISSPSIRWYFYDNKGDDSITLELLQLPEMKNMHVLVGSAGAADAAHVADFCRQNNIVNIQPFVQKKSLTTHNPFHLKLTPTIETHADNIFLSIVDSFPGANVIIYTPNADINLLVANRLDSLFKHYNSTAKNPFRVVTINTKFMTVDGKKTSAAEQLRPGRKNIWILTTFDENTINGNLRVMYDNRYRYDMVVYGMPNWLLHENTRLDYFNHFQVRLTDAYYLDTTLAPVREFVKDYETRYKTPINRYAVLGFDVARFVAEVLKQFGAKFLEALPSSRYKGMGYVFDIQKNIAPDTRINYYETKHVHVFMVSDYQLKKVW
ncbi:MAG: ABC transporter substrate-binding protein [Chitinophagales bacterium]|nr:ABC transporter substrate-binding protein [Chitinophagales bacterium]MDW8418088.1 ABC transporter substrate-binding protein [Chitinophagales bacterium]